MKHHLIAVPYWWKVTLFGSTSCSTWLSLIQPLLYIFILHQMVPASTLECQRPAVPLYYYLHTCGGALCAASIALDYDMEVFILNGLAKTESPLRLTRS
jgi:hypothetical protein